MVPSKPFLLEKRMNTIDEVLIKARSGAGGRGCVSFRREKYIPRGGPDGGDGGDGGSIIIKASRRHLTLRDYSSRRLFKAQNGQPGAGKNRTGKNGKDMVIEVPLGTIVYDHEINDIIADLTREGQEIVVLGGGKGGRGNQHFATATNRAPRMAQPGEPGQEKEFRLSLKYLADIGIIGLPNAGKSTLLSLLTKARPRVAGYPFTTLTPNLGIITFDDENTLTMADIPGLIEGAGEGRGLGHRFLKHIERTTLLLHLMDNTLIPPEDPLRGYRTVRRELENYAPSLAQKEEMVLITKMDLCAEGRGQIGLLKESLKGLGLEAIPISAVTGQGLEVLREALWRRFFDGAAGAETGPRKEGAA